MEDLSPHRKRVLLLFHSGKETLLKTGLITAVVATLCTGALTFALMPRVPIAHRSSALLLLFLATLFMGFMLRYEIMLSRKYRYPAGIPVYFTMVFLSWFAFGFLILVGDPSLTRSPVFQFLVLPFLLIFMGAILYGFLTKILFFKALERFSHPDYVSLHYRDQIWEYLNPIWETVRRYKDPCTVALLRLQVASNAESLTETLQRLQTTEGILKSQLRLTDRCGIHSRDTFFAIMPNTTLEASEIPLHRIKKALGGGGFEILNITSSDMRNATGTPRDFLASLESNLQVSNPGHA